MDTQILPPLPSVPEPTLVERTKLRPSTVPAAPVTEVLTTLPEVLPRQEIVVPPPPAPPTMPPTGAAEPGPSSRRTVLIVSVVVAVLAIGGGVAALLLTGGNDDRQQTTALLASARDKTVAVMRRAGAAGTVQQLRTAGGAASTTSDALGVIQRQLEAQGDPKLGGQAGPIVAAEKRYLDQLEPLRQIDAKHLSRWNGIKHPLIDASRDVVAAATPLPGLKLTHPTPLVVSTDELSKTTNQINALVLSGQRRLNTYHAALASWRAQQRAALVPVTSYRSAVQSILVSYDAARAKTDRFANSASGRTNMDIARSSIDQQISARDDLIARLGQLKVPTDVRSANAEIARLISDSIDALGYATSATYQWADDADTLPQQPDWRTFQDRSTDLASRRPGVIARWQSAVGTALSDAQASARTDPPKVPRI